MFDKLQNGRWWDEGWKLVEGCTRVSPACDNCGDISMDKRVDGTEAVSVRPERLNKPLKRKKPTVFAVWNDLFHEDVPDDFINKVMAVIALCPQHRFVVLTKRAERMYKYFTFELGGITRPNVISYQRTKITKCTEQGLLNWPLPNLWLGVTAENQEQLEKRLQYLIETPAAKRFVSIEPMLGDVILEDYDAKLGKPYLNRSYLRRSIIPPTTNTKTGIKTPRKVVRERIDWVICGGESGNNARPMHPDWVRILRNQCHEAGVPFYFKGWGSWMPFYDRDMDDPDWRNVPKESKRVRYMNLSGGWGFHGERVVYFKKETKNRLLDGKKHNAVPECQS